MTKRKKEGKFERDKWKRSKDVSTPCINLHQVQECLMFLSEPRASKQPEHARVGKFSYILSDAVSGKKLNSIPCAPRNEERHNIRERENSSLILDRISKNDENFITVNYSSSANLNLLPLSLVGAVLL